MKKNRLIITSLISIILVAILMLGSTYSVFTTGNIDETLNVYKTGILDITYTLSSDNIIFDDYNPISNEDSIQLTPYRLTVFNNGTVPYMFNVILEDVTATNTIDSQYIMTQVGKLEPQRLAAGSVTDNPNYYIIKEAIILPANSSVDIDVRVWLAEDIINTEIGKSFNARLVIDGLAIYDQNTEIDNSILTADIMQPLSERIINLYHDGSELTTVNIGGDTTKPTVTQNTDQGLMLDNNGEYRYYGSNPNNYVEFNGELWRIISVSNIKDDETDTSGTMRVKIIRNEIIGNYSWDSSAETINSGLGVNSWEQSDLNYELNSLYYNQESGTCYNGKNNQTTDCNFTNIGLNTEARNLIDDALWYLGQDNGANLYANDHYDFERSDKVYSCTIDDGACPREATWTGKIGLMYPSDYMYATDLSVCYGVGNSTDASITDYKTADCKDNDWLWYNDSTWQWTISPIYDNPTPVFYISAEGHVYANGAYAPLQVRPVTYLRADTMFYGGDGTSTNPYKLHIENDYLSTHIINLYNDGSELTTVNIGADTSKPTVTQNTEQELMLDNNGEYRYYGNNPNNYVEFNGELWRIISVSNIKNNSNDNIGNIRVKIIKDESIGNYSFDSSSSTVNLGYGINDWTQADLNTELNELYYNQKSGTCYNGIDNASTTCDFTDIGLNDVAKNLIDDALWYLGGSSISEYLYANDYYNFERGTEVYDCSTDDGSCPRATTWTGKIAVMYPSDYLYATNLKLCTQPGYNSTNSNLSYSNASCKSNNWLIMDLNQWVLSPYTVLPRGMFALFLDGFIKEIGGAFDASVVRPVVYLKDNVLITSGLGTKDLPYQITIDSSLTT